MLAPVFDHVGVRHYLLRESDFKSVVRSAREDLLEDEPVVRFGELQRSIHYGDLDSSALINLFPHEGACVVEANRKVEFKLDLAAARARIGVRLSSTDEDWTASIALGDDLLIDGLADGLQDTFDSTEAYLENR